MRGLCVPTTGATPGQLAVATRSARAAAKTGGFAVNVDAALFQGDKGWNSALPSKHMLLAFWSLESAMRSGELPHNVQRRQERQFPMSTARMDRISVAFLDVIQHSFARVI